MAGIAIGVDIFEGVSYQAFMSQVFVHCIAVATMTVRAAVFEDMNVMPFTFPIHWGYFFVTGDTRGIGRVVATLRASCGREYHP
jgi:hypothetical protein